MTRLRYVALVAVVGGCSARQHGSTATDDHGFTPGLYVLTVKSATIEQRRPDGSPWHETKPDKTMFVVGALAGLAVGQPELGASVGDALSDPGGEPLPPSAYVRIRALGRTLTTQSVEQSYSPTWNETLALDARALSGQESAIIWIIDSTNETLIASGSVSLTELLSKKSSVIELNGSVRGLEVEVVPDSGEGVDDATRQDMMR